MQDGNLQNPQSTFSDVKIEDGFSKIRENVFVGRYPALHKYPWQNLPESFYADEKIFRPYFVNVQRDQTLYKDICCHGLADMGSVSFPAIHFALFTYPKEIYLVGCDTSRTRHFYDDPKKVPADKSMFNTAKMKVGYARMKMFAKQFYPDTEIISLNPVGLKGLFRDIYTDDYKASLNKEK